MKKKQIAITLGIMCFILTLGIVVQLNTIEEATTAVGKTRIDSKLKDEVLKWKEKYEIKYEELQVVEKELEKERQVSLSTDETSVDKQKKLKELNAYLGLTDVVGEGVIITVQDNTSSILGTANDVVHDGDLRKLVSEIKNTNAEAISINGQRIVQSTAINCVGALVQVNNESIGSPFVIKVIGEKNTLYNNLLRPGSYLDYLDRAGLIVKVEKSDEITIEKYKGVLTDKYIKSME